MTTPRRARQKKRFFLGVCAWWPRIPQVLACLRRAAFRFDPESLEFQTGLLALALGVWLLVLPTQWQHRPSNFSLMLLRLWSAPLWASLFLLIGGAQLAALSQSRLTLRCACAMTGFCLWSFVAVLLAMDGLPGPSVSLFPVIALSEAWVYLRLRAHGDSPSAKPGSEDEPPPQRT